MVEETVEKQRFEKQIVLDSYKTPGERNKLGQFSTSKNLSDDILKFSKKILKSKKEIKFFDPAFGTGVFFSSLIRTYLLQNLKKSVGFEIDPHYGNEAKKIWEEFSIKIKVSDFFKERPPKKIEEKFNLIVCNPPYIRHHHLDKQFKLELKKKFTNKYGYDFSGLTGFYCYYLINSLDWMDDGGVGFWLIPSEFMDVNYGKSIKKFLLNDVELLGIHRFDINESKFADALVSSCIVYFRNSKKKAKKINLTFGNNLNKPDKKIELKYQEFDEKEKWSQYFISEIVSEDENDLGFKLNDLFSIKRGLATGANNFFILTKEKVREKKLPQKFLKPIFPSPRYLKLDRVDADRNGKPKYKDMLYLLSCDLEEKEIQKKYPKLYSYLLEGKSQGVHNNYLCKNRKRWYLQEHRKPAPFLCTYMGRKNKDNSVPFRFVLNESKAIATNSYLMLYPKEKLQEILETDKSILERIWKLLNEINSSSFTKEGRTYGGGLHKIEPKELGMVKIG